LDLGHGRLLVPTRYCIRNGGPGKGDTLRNWELRAKVSEDEDWVVLRTHVNDTKLTDKAYSSASWKLRPKPSMLHRMKEALQNPQTIIGSVREAMHAPSSILDQMKSPVCNAQKTWADTQGFRHFMLIQTGPNTSGNDNLLIGGIELFGTLTEALDA
jgi:hypothetical protein